MQSRTIDEVIQVFDSTFLETYCDLFPGKHISELESTTNEHVMQYCVTTHRQELVNVLIGKFRPSQDRCVITVQQIESDDRIPGHYRQRSRKRWIELTQLSNGHTICRKLLIVGPSYFHDGRYDVHEDARDFEIDLTDCPPRLLELTFIRCLRERIHAIAQYVGRFYHYAEEDTTSFQAV